LPAEAVEIMRSYQAGETVTELAKQHQLAVASVSACLRRSGVVLRARRVPDEADVVRAIELYGLGWSAAKIGRELGFDQKTIWRHLHDKVQMREPWYHPKRES
jgi:DNA-binding NarL/FixJ family response regulator